MIDRSTQFKIQAFLDGELAENEAREVAALIAADRNAAALHAELKHTRQALQGAEPALQLPETREFYWSRISREIERLERQNPRATKAISVWHSLAAWLKPLGAVAAVAVVSLLVWQQLESGPAAPGLVTAQVDSDAMTFQDDKSGTTLVWFNYPVQNGVANNGD